MLKQLTRLQRWKYGRLLLLVICFILSGNLLFRGLTYQGIPSTTIQKEGGIRKESRLIESGSHDTGLVDDGEFAHAQTLAGAVFKQHAMSDELLTKVVVSVPHSFSPTTEQTVAKMFSDDLNENIYHGIAPAITWADDEIIVVQRLWLVQFEHSVYYKTEKQLRNTWHESYFYTQKFNKNYEPTTKGELMGIPVPSNSQFDYRSDGPMDPRLIWVNGTLYVSFHIWIWDDKDKASRGRMHLWNCQENSIKRLNVRDYDFLVVEINWAPLEINGSLYYIYTLDPFRVLKCEPSTGDCHFVVNDSPDNNRFEYNREHLRGGSPFLLYKWPYYIGMAHSVIVSQTPKENFGIYNTHLVIISVEPTFRIVYVSAQIQFKEKFLNQFPIARPYAQMRPFVFPVGIIFRNDDVIDVGAHLNDNSGYVIRLRGIRTLVRDAIALDKHHGRRSRPSPLVVNGYVRSRLKSANRDMTFKGEEFYKDLGH
ncbi:uncharacterized protein LOC106156882 isoform X2 [Lingula anatina]|nr:uncharacterized protein LOC106156882 isoform X2 [Lingula anatina]XP_013387770.1 uncharacterized protein LOC106156882 isoform X2 [Lingula anatina]XP_013387771.1 uncharacterized protein LOC106156882 isoform X2 [Lingula anatina]XP_013387772.1 uncharacterized protein LOC106156882 isoform X2 [Lingula anatina]|eukprot:XP_013387769.1 uncharacterized protein LOC106156882 isoform X2 [Lingula anatina]